MACARLLEPGTAESGDAPDPRTAAAPPEAENSSALRPHCRGSTRSQWTPAHFALVGAGIPQLGEEPFYCVQPRAATALGESATAARGDSGSARWWRITAQALAAQDQDAGLKTRFAPLAAALAQNEAKIVAELNGAQGKPVDIGGYYHPDLAKTGTAMRPSATFNAALAAL